MCLLSWLKFPLMSSPHSWNRGSLLGAVFFIKPKDGNIPNMHPWMCGYRHIIEYLAIKGIKVLIHAASWMK